MYNPNLHFHFTGIGGSGMSGIAEILLNLGFKVSGSDLRFSETCQRLEKLGAEVFEGHSSDNVPESSSLLVYSSAVQDDNAEVVEARKREIPVIPRAAVLAELMRLRFGVAVAGSHGKTTTTSMTGAIMEQGGLDPTVIIGGIVKSIGSGGKLGKGEFLVAESDESDRSFLLLKPTIAVVTNIDAEHLQAYASLAELEESFEKFVNAVPFYGLAVLCVDDHKVRDLSERYTGRKVTYGFSPDAQVKAENVVLDKYSVSYDLYLEGKLLARIDLPLPGRHMVLNSLAAISVGLEFGVSVETIGNSLREFSGVKRRMEIVGETAGVTVLNDYGHHPTEIKATLRAVREGWNEELNKLHVIFQPHRYSRTQDCFVDFIDAFADCDNLIISKIYAAGEAPIEGVTAQLLCDAVLQPCPKYVENLEDIIPGLFKELKPGDVVLCLGAGSIGAFSSRFFEEYSKYVDR